jgi:hypothetical protein
MLGTLEDEITLELARLRRAALARARERAASLQLGEAWIGLEALSAPSPETSDSQRASDRTSSSTERP